jgi:hypothetical protein
MFRPEGRRPLYLSPRFAEKDWRTAFDGFKDWNAAVDIVEDRIKGRWLDAADRLLDEPYSGFAILALDCIVIESMWGFMNGEPAPSSREGAKQVYRFILKRSSFGFTNPQSDGFHALSSQRHHARRGN